MPLLANLKTHLRIRISKHHPDDGNRETKRRVFSRTHTLYTAKKKNDDADFSIDIIAVLFRETLPTRVKHHLTRFPLLLRTVSMGQPVGCENTVPERERGVLQLGGEDQEPISQQASPRYFATP